MAMRSTLALLGLARSMWKFRIGVSVARSVVSTRVANRCFSDGKGRVLSEEERAKESIYIQKMEKERLEKQRQKAEKEKEGVEKKSEGGKP